MRAGITVTFEGINVEELQEAIQSLRDIEQHDPERIKMFISADTLEMSVEATQAMLLSIKPPLTYFSILKNRFNAWDDMR